MDEWILDDLLECSVCLERLDTSSKVLPCQHTFCKKCLEEILRTQAELRCPECRILVDTKIDDLPPNVLLMRILEGLGGASKRTVVRGGGSIIFSNTTTIGPNESRTTNIQQTQQQIHQQQQLQLQQQQQQSSHHHHHHHHHAHPHLHHQLHNDGTIVTHHANQPCARATYDYISKEPGDLSFKKGDIILLRKKIDSNWYHGECNGNHGVFPLSYVQIMVPLPTHIQAQCRALYDFKMGSDEEDGCLEFHKGDIITVMRRVDENWAEGKLGDKIGIFPLAFVELNSVAKALIKPHPENQAGPSRVAPPTPASREEGNSMPSTNLQQQSQVTSLVGLPAVVSDSSSASLTSPSSSCSSSTPTTSSNHSSPSSPPPPPAPNKRHSFGTSTLQNGNNMKINRHSAEILNVPEGFIPAQNALNVDVFGIDQHCQLIRHGSQKHRRINSTDIAPVPAPPPGPQLQHSSLQLPASYVALYPYKPQKGDELELKRGAVYTVTERCQDGWFKGTAARGHKAGVFPGNYVAPAKSLPALQAQVRGLCRTGVTNNTGSPRNNITPPVEPRSLVTYTKPTANPNPVQSSIAVQPNQSTTTEQPRIQDQPSIIQTTQNATSTLQQSATTTAKSSADKGHNRDKKEKCGVSLMRRLASIKKSKSPPPTPYSLDNPVFEDLSLSQHVHIRSGSCPNQLLSSTNLETPHRIFSPTSSHRSKQRERPSISRIAPRMNTERSPTTGVEHRKCNSMDNQTMVTPQDLCTINAGRLIDDVSTPNRINGDNIQPLPRAPIHDFPNTQTEQQQRQENTTSSCSTSTTIVQLPPPPRVDSSTINNDNESTKQQQLIVATTTRRQQNVEQNVDVKVQQQPPPPTQNLPQRISTSHPGPHKIFTSPKNQSSGGGGGGHHVRERFLCIVPYPPNSEYELELRLGDVIYVHKKRDDGWYKGTQQRTGRTGLFPASFVQSF